VTLVKGERATFSMSLRSAVVKACDAGARQSKTKIAVKKNESISKEGNGFSSKE
jgi:hypothetical protein